MLHVFVVAKDKEEIVSKHDQVVVLDMRLRGDSEVSQDGKVSTLYLGSLIF
jgi:hypothetical protein